MVAGSVALDVLTLPVQLLAFLFLGVSSEDTVTPSAGRTLGLDAAPGASTMRSMRSSALLLFLLLPLSGCIVAAAAVAGAAVYGVMKYENNEAVRYYEADYAKTHHATLKVMRTEGYPVQEGVAPDAAGTTDIELNDVHVAVVRHGEKSTAVRVRIGTFESEDHKAKAERLLAKVARELGVP